MVKWILGVATLATALVVAFTVPTAMSLQQTGEVLKTAENMQCAGADLSVNSLTMYLAAGGAFLGCVVLSFVGEKFYGTKG